MGEIKTKTQNKKKNKIVMSTGTTNKPADDQLVELPRGGYKLRCLECTGGTSAVSQNPILIQQFEVYGHPNDRYNGVKISNRSGLSGKALPFVNQQRASLGLPAISNDEMDTVNPKEYVGQEGAALISVKRTEEKDDNGEPLLNPITGKPIVSSFVQIEQWLPRN